MYCENTERRIVMYNVMLECSTCMCCSKCKSLDQYVGVGEQSIMK